MVRYMAGEVGCGQIYGWGGGWLWSDIWLGRRLAVVRYMAGEAGCGQIYGWGGGWLCRLQRLSRLTQRERGKGGLREKVREIGRERERECVCVCVCV